MLVGRASIGKQKIRLGIVMSVGENPTFILGGDIMAKIRYWNKTLIELDTETNKVRIIQNYAQPVAGTGTKKKKAEDLKVQESGELIL